MIGWFLIFFGAATFLLGWYNSTIGDDNLNLNLNLYHFIFFLPGIIFSPGIFIFIKFLAISKPKNDFVQSESMYGSRGEAILEAAPQMILQLYVVLVSMKPSENQFFSIITSAATLSLPNIEQFISARSGTFGFQLVIKNIFVFLPASLFKVLAISIICLYFTGWIMLVILCIVILLSVCILLVNRCYEWEVSKDLQLSLECILLSWLTLTSLGKDKRATIYRLWSTLITTFIYILILTAILVICNVDPNIGVIWSRQVAAALMKRN